MSASTGILRGNEDQLLIFIHTYSTRTASPTIGTVPWLTVARGRARTQKRGAVLFFCCQLSVIGWQLSVVSCQLSVVSYRLSVVGYQLTVVSYQLSVVSYQLSVVGYRLSVVSCRLSVIRYQLSVIGYRLAVVGYRLSGISCQLSVVSCRLAVVVVATLRRVLPCAWLPCFYHVGELAAYVRIVLQASYKKATPYA